MRIVTLRITNFRSFGPTTQSLQFDQALLCFIGLNSSGKTAALEALRKLFGDRIDRSLHKEDFHIPTAEEPLRPGAKSLSIEVDIKFDVNDPAIPLFAGLYTLDDHGADPYMRIRLEASWAPSLSSAEGEIEARQWFIIRSANPGDADEKREFNRAMYGLFQVIYIPALRKTSDQLRFASGSILHRLLKNVDFTPEFRGSVRDQVGQLNGLFTGLPGFGIIQATLQESWAQFHRDGRFRDATMKFGTGDIDEVLRKLEIHFSPAPGGHRNFGIGDLGDGYRSLFYITMVCALLRVEQVQAVFELGDEIVRPALTLLLVEEPENHIAPQILGRVIKILTEISHRPEVMVFLSSHTPAIVKRLEPESIYHFRMNEENGTEVNSIELPPLTADAYKYVKEAVQNYPEIYFAKVVMIGEGDSEDVVLRHTMKVMNVDFDDNVITFAPLGHRFVHHIWKLLNRLKIPCVTLLDLDLGRHLGGWGRIKYALQELVAVGNDRERVLRLAEQPVLSEDNLENMHLRRNRPVDILELREWLAQLESFDLYYSTKLDLDFLMLKTYPEYYTSREMVPAGGGPRIPAPDPAERYQAYIEKAVVATLKQEEYPEGIYPEGDRALMTWYNYHFLGRGKPVTHIQALASIPDAIFRERLPAVFNRIFDRIRVKLG
jgi:putative ATP-dependent endonuclease of the OLD family